MPESTTAQPTDAFDFDTDDILAELDEEETEGADGQQEPDAPPADEAPADAEGDAPADAESDDPDAELFDDGPADDAAPGEQTPVASSEPEEGLDPEPEPEPFSFTVEGEQVTPEGAYVIDGMVVMPVETFQRKLMPNYVGSRRVWQEKERGYKRQLEAKVAAEEQAQVLLTKLTGLLDDPNELAAFLNDFDTQVPVLKAQAEAAAARAEAENLKRAQAPPEPEPISDEELLPVLETGLKDWIGRLAQDEKYRGVEFDVPGLVETLMATPETIFAIAPEDDPERGVKKDMPGVRLDVLERMLDREAAIARRYAQRTEKAVTTARKNGNGPRKQAPPTVGSASTASGSAPEKKAPENHAEWVAWLEEDDE